MRKINNFTKTLSLRAKVPNTYGPRLYTLYNVHIGSLLYLGIILHYIQNVCKNKCAVCTLYSVYITYFRLGPHASF